MGVDLRELSLSRASEMLASGEVSSVRLTEAFLQRIDEFNPSLHAYITVMRDSALADAEAADAELRRGTASGPLCGIPVAVKDSFETRGVRTTNGTAMLADNIPDNDAVAVARLRSAGAVLLGKLNMHEWQWGTSSANPFFGVCCNPWDPKRVPGGSSGGCATALAAGLCLGALGGDTGGSIRLPASYCGVAGLKPAAGRVSPCGTVPLSWTLDTVGPMARETRDTAILLTAIAGPDEHDPAALSGSVPDYRSEIDAGVEGWTIARIAGPELNVAEPEIRHAFRAATEVFERLGARMVEVDLGLLKHALGLNRVITAVEALALHLKTFPERATEYGSDVRKRLENAQTISAVEYALAQRDRSVVAEQLRQRLGDIDLLLTPTTLTPAPLADVGQAGSLPESFYLQLFNLVGLPALSLPCGFTSTNLPIGLQIISPTADESDVLRAGQAYERAAGWSSHHPVL